MNKRDHEIWKYRVQLLGVIWIFWPIFLAIAIFCVWIGLSWTA